MWMAKFTNSGATIVKMVACFAVGSASKYLLAALSHISFFKPSLLSKLLSKEYSGEK